MSIFFQVISQNPLEDKDGCADSCGVDSSQLLIIAWLSSAIVHHTKYFSYQDKPDMWRGVIIFSPAYNGPHILGKSKPSENK